MSSEENSIEDTTEEITNCAQKDFDADDNCPDEDLNKMTASAACNKIDEAKKSVWGWLSETVSDFSPASLASAIGDALGSDNDSSNEVINNIRQNLSSKGLVNSLNECRQNATASASNVIDGTALSECNEELAKLGMSAEEIRTTISNINQTATATSSNECDITSMINIVSSMDASIDNQALIDVMQEANGLLSGSSSNNEFCNNLEINQSACNYVNQQNCCANTASATASNLIKMGCLTDMDNINQTATTNASNVCKIASASGFDSDMSSFITNKVESTTNQTASGMSLGMMVVILIIIAILFLAPFFLALKILPTFDLNEGKESAAPSKIFAKFKLILMFTVIGLLLFITGSIFLGLFFNSKTSEIWQHQNPFSSCDSTFLSTVKDIATDALNPLNGFTTLSEIGDEPYVGTRATYAEAKTNTENNAYIKGFDFMVDKEDGNFPNGVDDENPISVSNPPKDDQKGTVLYLSQVNVQPKTCDKIGGENPNKLSTYSYAKASQNNMYLILASTGLGCGTLLLMCAGGIVAFL